jgi:hypothetical protein
MVSTAGKDLLTLMSSPPESEIRIAPRRQHTTRCLLIHSGFINRQRRRRHCGLPTPQWSECYIFVCWRFARQGVSRRQRTAIALHRSVNWGNRRYRDRHSGSNHLRNGLLLVRSKPLIMRHELTRRQYVYFHWRIRCEPTI